jgi:exonuclease III
MYGRIPRAGFAVPHTREEFHVTRSSFERITGRHVVEETGRLHTTTHLNRSLALQLGGDALTFTKNLHETQLITTFTNSIDAQSSHKIQCSGKSWRSGSQDEVATSNQAAVNTSQIAEMDREISPPPLKRRRIASTPVLGHQKEPHTPPTLRLFSWNINGISPFIQQPITSFFTSDKSPPTQPHASLRDFLRRQGFPTLLFLQEVKINPSDDASQKAVSNAVKRGQSEPETNPDYATHFSLPQDKYNATAFGRKIYGVCSIIRKDFADQYVERMRTVDWDAEGRFSVIETKPLPDLPKLAIFNVYMVNGTENPYKDPSSGAVTGTRHERKLEVHRLLQEEVRGLQRDGFGVVVAGDINIACAPIDGHPNLRTFPQQHVLNRQDFIRRFLGDGDGDDESEHALNVEGGGADSTPSLGMVDTFRSLHTNTKGYSYYPRGRAFGDSCDRVDMILCSHSLAAKCTEAGMLATPADRGPSDHVPILASFDVYRPD